jgi:hypothetical protein
VSTLPGLWANALALQSLANNESPATITCSGGSGNGHVHGAFGAAVVLCTSRRTGHAPDPSAGRLRGDAVWRLVPDWDSPVPDSYYKLIKHHLTELHTRYRTPYYQLLDITWKISQEQRWKLYRLIKSMSPECIAVMNQGFYQSRRNLGRICETASWPSDVINAEDTLPPEGGHDPNVKVAGAMHYLPMEAWIPTGPLYKPMPPMHSWFWRPGFKTQDPQLNLSPDTSGRLPDEAVEAMQQVAKLIRG